MGIEHSTPTAKREKDIINTYSKCMWCPNHIIKPTPHRNRKHALLHCNRPDLLRFREKMTNLIEQKLKNLFVATIKYWKMQKIKFRGKIHLCIYGGIKEEVQPS